MKKIHRGYLIGFIALWILLGLAFITLVVFIDRYIDGFLDYDLSAELINGRIMADEGSYIAEDWLFSTELRVLNVPLMFSFFFRFFKSWHTVRVLSSAALNLILIISAVFCSFQMGMKKTAPILGLLVILPISQTYMEYVVCGLYYIPHIVVSLFTVGGLYSLLRNPERSRRSVVIIVILALLSFLSGMEGYRLVVNLYLPIAVTLGFMYYLGHRKTEKNRLFVYGIIVCCVMAMIGVFCNNRLHNVYSFEKQTLCLKYMDITELGILINPILKCFGFAEGEWTFWSLFRNGFCFIVIILTVMSIAFHLKSKNDENVFLSIYFIVAMVIMFGVFLFTEQLFHERYYLPVLIYSYFLIMKMICGMARRKIWKYAVVALVLLLACGSSFNMFKIYKYHNINVEVQEILEYLKENNYMNGYSTGWYSGPLTELSDGAIDVWKWVDGDIDHQTSIDILLPWLQRKSHLENHPAGKVFILLSKEEYAIFPMRDRIIDNQIYETEGLLLFGFDSYEQCKEVCEGE